MTAPKTDEGCIFCNARSGDRSPEETLLLLNGERVIVMLNRYPYSNGHLMIAPAAHVARLYDSDGAALEEIIRLTAQAQRILSDVYQPEGFNIGMNFGKVAGAGVADHYHVHVVPRWGGDSNFMSVTAQTRLVPEELETTFAKLQPRFRELEKQRP